MLLDEGERVYTGTWCSTQAEKGEPSSQFHSQSTPAIQCSEIKACAFDQTPRAQWKTAINIAGTSAPIHIKRYRRLASCGQLSLSVLTL